MALAAGAGVSEGAATVGGREDIVAAEPASGSGDAAAWLETGGVGKIAFGFTGAGGRTAGQGGRATVGGGEGMAGSGLASIAVAAAGGSGMFGTWDKGSGVAVSIGISGIAASEVSCGGIADLTSVGANSTVTAAVFGTEESFAR